MKTLALSLIIFSLALTGCQAKEEAKNLGSDLKNSYDNITGEIKEVTDDLQAKKEKLDETVEDVQNAANAIKGAVEAVEKVTE